MPDRLTDAQREAIARAVFMADTGWPAFMWRQVNDEQKARCREIADAALAALPREVEGLRERAVQMRRWGDEMQSEASRLASAVDYDALPYEARLALVSVRGLAEDWTAFRRSEAVASPVASREVEGDEEPVYSEADMRDAELAAGQEAYRDGLRDSPSRESE